ncbi:UAA transporter [Rhizophlyctis rosea]|uniref:UAA transporter n=1 Tax=Rhizophlyctis rosea TaxID=64517 RepID=A0AAD5S5D3_9FUNG|nr:UAA transporter [Rhizophlyctis rosea]
MILSIIFLKKTYSTPIWLTMIPIIFGVTLSTQSQPTTASPKSPTQNLYTSFFTYGFLITLLGAVLAAAKTVVTNIVQVGGLKLHPLDLLLRMSPLALVQSLIIGYHAGEWDRLPAYWASSTSKGVGWALFFNGLIAFGLNVVSFTTNKKTGALTICVAGNVKQVLSIVLAIIIFHTTVTSRNALGIVITLAGGALYSYVDYLEKHRKGTHQALPTHDMREKLPK